MSNVNQAFIKVYRGHDDPSAPVDELRAQRPKSSAAAKLQQAQGTCVVGVWTGDGDSAARSADDDGQRAAGHESQSPLSARSGPGSHLPAVLAAAAAASETDLMEFPDRAAGVEYLRPFVPLPRHRDTRAASPEPAAQPAPAPRARVIVVNEHAHAVPPPHFDVAAAALETAPAAPRAPTVQTPQPIPPQAAAPPSTPPQATPSQAAPAQAAPAQAAPPQHPQPQAATVVPSNGPFRPAWEVDNFEWPAAIGQLFAEQPDRFDALAERVVQLADAGSRKIAVVGSCPGAGSTTLALCLARRLSEVVQEIALVDGNVGNPRLAADLDVCLEAGWEEVLAGCQAVEEAAVTAVENGITLLPLLNPDLVADATEIAERAVQVHQRLAATHDLVLVDAGPVWGKGVELLTAGQREAAVDAAILVRDVRQTTERELKVAVAELTSRGIAVIAIAENFQNMAAGQGLREAA